MARRGVWQSSEPRGQIPHTDGLFRSGGQWRYPALVSGFLEQAGAEAHERVAEATALVSLDELRGIASAAPAPPSLAEALAAPGCQLVAEIKRASPSGGHLAWVPDPAARSRAYTTAGAAAVSVLTEPSHFRGTLADLAVVAGAVAVPVLRKDFVVDAYQVWEARAAGASAVLLIVAALDDPTLRRLLAEAAEAGVETLVEVHDPDEAHRAGQALAASGDARPVVGVNARDLSTLHVHADRFAACADALPPTALTIAESGVSGDDDVRRAADAGADAVLVGEHLTAVADPRERVRDLVAAGRAAVTADRSPP